MTWTVADRLVRAWQRTDQIFGTLGPGAFLARPIALRHPFIFYAGHLPAFAWNHVCAGALARPSFRPDFDAVFARGIDPDVDEPDHGHDHPAVPDRWPDLDEVLRYRDRVRREVLAAVDLVPERAAGDLMARNGRVFSMVVEHELMHQETLLYMVQQLAPELKVAPDWLPAFRLGSSRAPREVSVPAGRATLGAGFETVDFGWDNEFPRTAVDVPAFTIDAVPVTIGEFLVFVESGGYERPVLWRDEDWAWRIASGLAHPASWVRRDGAWLCRTAFHLLPLGEVEGWPVSVSLAEARAFARWRGRRLPLEAEFHRAAYGQAAGGDRRAPRGDQAGDEGPASLDFRLWAPAPAGADPIGASAWGVHELVGNGWEWTDTPFSGFPGFTPYIDRYREYSADFFDGKHYVLKGGSWATAAELVRPSFRNWFQAHYPYVFTKFRCVAAG
jgi:ergothioneine biosynthesis protein EgtB